jgi:hypothetical protein
MIKRLPGKIHTTGSDPNTAVSNAIEVGKIALASELKQRIPNSKPRVLTSTAMDRFNASKQRKTTGQQFAVGMREKPVTTKTSTAASLLVQNIPQTEIKLNSKSAHVAKGSAISSDTPCWFHMKGIPVVTIDEKYQHKHNRENIKSGHGSPRTVQVQQPGDDNPHSTQAMMATSRAMPPQFKIPYKRGRTVRIASAEESDQNKQNNQSIRGTPKDSMYYVRRAGLNPLEKHTPRLHKDVHDGNIQSDYVIPKSGGKYHFVNPNLPKDADVIPKHTHDISAFSDNCPDWMHIPMVPIVPAKYKKGVGGAEVVSCANNASAWHRFDHDNPNVKMQHPHDVTVTSQAAPEWMHSPRKDLKDAAKPMKWRRPEPMTTQHNISAAHARSRPGDRGHHYFYLRHPNQQRIGYNDVKHKHSEKTKSSDGTYKSIPHSSAVSQYGPGHFHIQGVPLLKFEHSKSDPSAGVYVHGVRPQTADAPRDIRRNHPSARRGAISFDAPKHMKVPGIQVSGPPVPTMEPTFYGKDRQPILEKQVKLQIQKKLSTVKRRLTANNPQQRGSTVLGRAPSNPDGTPIYSRPTTLKEQAQRAALAAKGNVVVPARPSTSSNDGRNGTFLGSRRSRSKRATAKLSVPYATHYPLNPNAPLPFWAKMDYKRQQQQQQEQQQKQQQLTRPSNSSGKEITVRNATNTNNIVPQQKSAATNLKERKIAELRAEIARLERT